MVHPTPAMETRREAPWDAPEKLAALAVVRAWSLGVAAQRRQAVGLWCRWQQEGRVGPGRSLDGAGWAAGDSCASRAVG